MKKCKCFSIAAMMLGLLISLVPSQVLAAFSSGSDGSDGALMVSIDGETTSVSVGGVVVGSALPLDEDGVFHFTTVTVESGATLTFINNEANTPVTMLATGDVNIVGTISVDGKNGSGRDGGQPGPGGYTGGMGGQPKYAGKRGYGPGGGGVGARLATSYIGITGIGAGGGFGSVGSNGYSFPDYGGAGGQVYGNVRCFPLMGGSGGGGGSATTGYAGGGGGGGAGALLIAADGDLTLTGLIRANGGSGAYGLYYDSSGNDYYGGGGGGGAGGAIRLLANSILGTGRLQAIGGTGGRGGASTSTARGGTGGQGRISLESASGTISQSLIALEPVPATSIITDLYPADLPTLNIISIGGKAVPSSSRGLLDSPDIWLDYSTTNPIEITVEAQNIPLLGSPSLTLKAIPSVGDIASAIAPLVGSDLSSQATVSVPLSTTYPSILTAYVTYELVAVNGQRPVIDGEQIARVKVESSLGGESRLFYITESGREIPM
ncbi:hypothetical protein [uncultured Desulfuromusa sp.]|uniref:hypothetical protein n=1 Tax=uncultured Desulfuromusa sp. TaxID=219183 RepID=UPI002AA71FEB|nr:hypothetical protein [uncultured Desulfuromusa sp.]